VASVVMITAVRSHRAGSDLSLLGSRLTCVHPAVLAAPVVLSRGAARWQERARCREPLLPWLISTPSSAAPTSAAVTRAVLIGQPSSDQISAAVTGLGGGATNSGTITIPSHAPAH
jgi:hypothetical protein